MLTGTSFKRFVADVFNRWIDLGEIFQMVQQSLKPVTSTSGEPLIIQWAITRPKPPADKIPMEFNINSSSVCVWDVSKCVTFLCGQFWSIFSQYNFFLQNVRSRPRLGQSGHMISTFYSELTDLCKKSMIFNYVLLQHNSVLIFAL